MQLQPILERMNAGIALLDCASLRVLYANTYLTSFAPEPWRSQGLAGKTVADILPVELFQQAEPLLHLACENGEKISLAELPYEGFLQTRGRTYWQITLEPAPPLAAPEHAHALLITVEDVTSRVRARSQSEAIRHISAAIAGQSPLHDVLDRILLAIQELAGSKRCAVLLIDAETDEVVAQRAFQARNDLLRADPRSVAPAVTIVAQLGLYPGAPGWHPFLSEHLLLDRVLRTRQAVVMTDTTIFPDLEFPVLDDEGRPRRPGAVISIPILETLPEGLPGAILGAIEIYHRRPRGLPVEEVEMMAQFAHQAGLAIQNARLFQRMKLLARVAGQQAHQLTNVMHAIPDGVIIYDAQWHLLEINPTARLLLGWSDEDLGRSIYEAVARSKARFAPNSPQVKEMIAALEQNSEQQDVDEFEMVGADGEAYTMRRSKAPIKDETGLTFAYVVVYHDVSSQAAARKQIEAEVRNRTAELAHRNAELQMAQAELRLYTDRLKLLLERLPVGVILVSLENQHINLINNHAIHLLERLGVTLPPELQNPENSDPETFQAGGVSIEPLLSPMLMYAPSGQPVPYEQRPLARALHLGEASEAELYTFDNNGDIINLLINAAPLRARDGSAMNAVLVWQDITHIKAMERAREDFFTIIAHELKTPLASIRAHLSALQVHDMTWSTEQQLNYLRTADEQVERLVSMINHFLDASRVEAGALRPDLEPVLLPEMCEDLQERLEALITASQRRLEIILPPQLPAVLIDYELIIRVLTNLLSNAFHYAPAGDTVLLEATLDSPQAVTLHVIDHGPGISPERQAELFTRFSSFAAARRPTNRPEPITDTGTGQRRQPGERWSATTGLGLYISRGIIEAHGSTLQVVSNLGEGTTFSFTLPVATPISAHAGNNLENNQKHEIR